MPKVLHVDFRHAEGWARPIVQAAAANRGLSAVYSRWRGSELSDLAFSVETRLGALKEIVAQVGEYLLGLSEALPRGDELERYFPTDTRPHGTAYTFHAPADRTIQRLLIALDAFVSQTRSTFENLARFYRVFVRDYFGEKVSQKGSYQVVSELFPDPAVAERLHDLRHELRHRHAPWIAFLVAGDPPRFEPRLSFDWRPEATAPSGFVTMTQLSEIHFGLWHARDHLQEALVRRIEKAAGPASP
jgi:hypothetical protein